MVEAPSASLAAAIDRAATLLGADPARAGRDAEAILKAAPNDPRALLILASAHRRLGRAEAAHRILAPLAAAHPNAARTQYELGAVLADLGAAAAGIAALRRALTLNRELPEAWRALGEALFREGDVSGADTAYAEFARTSVTDPALRRAADALFEGRPAAAEDLLRTRLAANPTDVAAMRLMAEAYQAQNRHGDAETLLMLSLELDPTHAGARLRYAEALFHQQKGAEAIAQLEPLLAAEPNNPAYLNLMAASLGLIGDEDRAVAIYEQLLADYPRQPKVWLNYAQSLRTVGRRDEAVAAYRRSITLAPGLGAAYWGLANLKVAQLTPDEEAAIERALEARGVPAEEQVQLHYALGKALEDRGDYAASFEHYTAGAAIRRGEGRYDADETTALVEQSKALFTTDFFAARAGQGSPSDAPIFIVGLPRSGSTLVEQILASHPAVEGTMELPDIGLIASRLRAAPGGYPDALASLGADALKALGESYIATTGPHRGLFRPFFTDKMPNNFQHVGLIQLILPHAKIVDVRRHPLASGFSAFKQHFAQGQSFSYDLADIGRYYRDYVDLMRHFDQVLPGRVHRVIYEDLVEDTEAEVRRLLTSCGLPFDAACLAFHENARAVRTVSSEQVRRPIFREGLDRWREYEPWLGPLKEALGPALENWRG
ncbi:MAG TPA: sulfotransferase [Caulobacteraceae bacterium]|nr:sulfotransferase [Caulobacteraceae bacterium]